MNLELLGVLDRYAKPALVAIVLTMAGGAWVWNEHTRLAQVQDAKTEKLQTWSDQLQHREIALIKRESVSDQRIGELEAKVAALEHEKAANAQLVAHASTANVLRDRERDAEKAIAEHVKRYATVDLSRTPPCDQLAAYEQARASLDRILTLSDGLPNRGRFLAFVARRADHGIVVVGPRCLPREDLVSSVTR